MRIRPNYLKKKKDVGEEKAEQEGEEMVQTRPFVTSTPDPRNGFPLIIRTQCEIRLFCVGARRRVAVIKERTPKSRCNIGITIVLNRVIAPTREEKK